jgi:trans-aconitate methyltransferase
MSGSAQHWDAAYALGDTTRSWYQERAQQSLEMLDRCGVATSDSLVDVGGGASVLVDDLLGIGFVDVTVLDISAAALEVARTRLGTSSASVTWLAENLLDWQPMRTFDVWHDRAVLHFLTEQDDRSRYCAALDAATVPGSVAVIATFAPEGPERCSGLPVRRYGFDDLQALLGSRWSLLSNAREAHTTPSGGDQPFTWAAFRRL